MAEGGGGERAHVCFVSKSTNPGHGIPQQMALKQDCCLARRSQQHFVLAKGHDCTNLGGVGGRTCTQQFGGWRGAGSRARKRRSLASEILTGYETVGGKVTDVNGGGRGVAVNCTAGTACHATTTGRRHGGRWSVSDTKRSGSLAENNHFDALVQGFCSVSPILSNTAKAAHHISQP